MVYEGILLNGHLMGGVVNAASLVLAAAAAGGAGLSLGLLGLAGAAMLPR